jgi:hypothetical protein
MNAIIHLCALLSFIALVFGLHLVQKQRDLLRKLLNPKYKNLVHIDWPLSFLKQLALAVGVPWREDIPINNNNNSPLAINLSVLAAFFKLYKIDCITLKKDELTSKQYLAFKLCNNQNVEDNWSDKLSHVLGFEVKITQEEVKKETN